MQIIIKVCGKKQSAASYGLKYIWFGKLNVLVILFLIATYMDKPVGFHAK